MGDWKENMGLSEDTDVVKIYTNSQIKEEWKREADAHNRSLSRHLFILIQEARFLQQEGELSFSDPPRDPDDSVQVETRNLADLNEEVEELSSQVEKQQEMIERLEGSLPKDDGGDGFDRGLVRDILGGKGQDIGELSEALLEHPEFHSWLADELENTLYSLGANGEARYCQGHGWKLIEDG